MQAENLDVSVDEARRLMTISGSRHQEHKVPEDKNSDEKDGSQVRYTRIERQSGQFVRRFPLPDDVDASAIKAEHKDGVLTVTLPRVSEQAQAGARKISVARL